MAAKKTQQVQKPLDIGDVVTLKSGGPAMTIHNFTDTQPRTAKCLWFHNGLVQDNTFLVHTLKRRETAKKRRPYRPY